MPARSSAAAGFRGKTILGASLTVALVVTAVVVTLEARDDGEARDEDQAPRSARVVRAHQFERPSVRALPPRSSVPRRGLASPKEPRQPPSRVPSAAVSADAPDDEPRPEAPTAELTAEGTAALARPGVMTLLTVQAAGEPTADSTPEHEERFDAVLSAHAGRMLDQSAP